MSKYQVTKTLLPESEVELKGEISSEVFEGERDHAIAELSLHLELPGFRKGKVPLDIAAKHIPEMTLLETMAEHAISHLYPEILKSEGVSAIGQPQIQITKIGKGSALGFTIKTAIMPELGLPDYKKIAKTEGKKVEIEIKDEDVEKTITDIRKMRAPKPEVKEGEEAKEAPEETWPELTDEFVKGLGPFENVLDFKIKLKGNMELEKKNQEHEKNRLRIMEKILDGTTVEIPKILVNAELDKMLHRMKADITNIGLSYEDYLKHLGKTEESIREEFKKDAEKRVKMELTLHEIATKEAIKPDPEHLKRDVEHLMNEYKDADKNRVEAYVEMMLTNEAVFAFLESQLEK